MASSSPKPSKRYSLRSISLPARSHPSTLRVEEQLNKIKSWEASTSSSKRVETICLGLSLLGELYRCIDDLLNLPLTQQALAQQQHQKWVNDLLEGSLGYLDVCGKTRDAILSMQESIRELQSALRRKRVGDLSVESIVTSYTCSRRLMKKEIVKSLASLKPIDHNQFGISPLLKPKPSSSRWSLVFKQLQKGVLAGKDQQAGNMQNELERVDTAVGNLLMHNSSQDMEAQKIQSAQIRLGALDVSMEGLEKADPSGIKRMFHVFWMKDLIPDPLLDFLSNQIG
ncbi:uncharacterized protein LOC121262225 [Juglans microcarpa x Juglans regia]|uniref:uncharacterized protein LOC121262225 n=1 Tax=Juglans microcarpa x Juglans regia TaxID=2249226 RepID=UPI001B7F5B88|nr:uncharacterized protein LOC121262225 [Juglans microcarpa x Juglans regia]